MLWEVIKDSLLLIFKRIIVPSHVLVELREVVESLLVSPRAADLDAFSFVVDDGIFARFPLTELVVVFTTFRAIGLLRESPVEIMISRNDDDTSRFDSKFFTQRS